MNDPIDDWSGDFEFLRNDYPCTVLFEGIEYPSVEHAFQAAKTVSFVERKSIAETLTASEAKTLGREFQLPFHWKSECLVVMEKLLETKFADEPFKSLLINTGQRELRMVTKRDFFWGVAFRYPNNYNGDNYLGRLLMKTREKLSSSVKCDLSHTDNMLASLKMKLNRITSSQTKEADRIFVAAEPESESAIITLEKNILNDVMSTGTELADNLGMGNVASLKVTLTLIEQDPKKYADLIEKFTEALAKLTKKFYEL